MIQPVRRLSNAAVGTVVIAVVFLGKTPDICVLGQLENWGNEAGSIVPNPNKFEAASRLVSIFTKSPCIFMSATHHELSSNLMG